MNKDQLQPIPTEYKGIVFRSKSEAIFARAIDLGFSHSTIWEYEPARFEIEGWIPDFLFSYRSNARHIVSGLIEYKPADVTDAYKRTLQRRFLELSSIVGNAINFRTILAIGSAWTSERTSMVIDGRGSWVPNLDWNVFARIEEAAQYRFDLKQ